jgi:hypothetical protein
MDTKTTALPSDAETLQEHADRLKILVAEALQSDAAFTRRYLLNEIAFLRKELDNVPKPAPLPLHIQREQLYREIMQLRRSFLVDFPDLNLGDLIQRKYNVAEVNLMTVEQVRSLRDFMRAALRMEPIKS